MLTIRNKILEIRQKREMTWETWATKVHKTPETLKKQLGVEANPTIETLSELLRPLGAALCVLTDEERADLDSLPELRQRLAALEEQKEIFEDNRKSKEAEILKQSAIIERQEANIAKLQKMLEDEAESARLKDAAIVRKDARIVELSKRLNIW